MKSFKSIATISLVTMMMLLSTTTVFATTFVSESYADITPFWDNTSNLNVVISFSGSTANCSAIVEGYTGTTKITADITLERKNTNGTYTTVKTWTKQNASATRLLFSDTYSIATGYTYRLTVTAKVTRNGTTETVSNSVEKAG